MISDLLVPKDTNSSIKVIVAGEGCQVSGEFLILKDDSEGEYNCYSPSEIEDPMEVKYNEEQALIAIFYGKDGVRACGLEGLMEEGTDRISTDRLAEYECVIVFACEFGKAK